MNTQLDHTYRVLPGRQVPAIEPVRGYAALAAGEALQPWSFEPGPLGQEEVELDITRFISTLASSRAWRARFRMATTSVIPKEPRSKNTLEPGG